MRIDPWEGEVAGKGEGASEGWTDGGALGCIPGEGSVDGTWFGEGRGIGE